MGLSFPISPWDKMAPTAYFDASIVIRKVFEKSGYCSNGAVHIISFSLSNAS